MSTKTKIWVIIAMCLIAYGLARGLKPKPKIYHARPPVTKVGVTSGISPSAPRTRVEEDYAVIIKMNGGPTRSFQKDETTGRQRVIMDSTDANQSGGVDGAQFVVHITEEQTSRLVTSVLLVFFYALIVLF